MTRVLTAPCACGHPRHGTPCEYGVADGREGTDRPCGCAPTCRLCWNYGFTIRRVFRDGEMEKDAEDCPRGCVGVAA